MMLRCASATHDPSPMTSRNRTQASSPTMRLRRRVWWYHAGRNSGSRMSGLLGSMRRLLLLLLRAAGRAGSGRDRRRTLDGAEHIDHFHGAGVVLGGRRRGAGVVLVAAF